VVVVVAVAVVESVLPVVMMGVRDALVDDDDDDDDGPGHAEESGGVPREKIANGAKRRLGGFSPCRGA